MSKFTVLFVVVAAILYLIFMMVGCQEYQTTYQQPIQYQQVQPIYNTGYNQSPSVVVVHQYTTPRPVVQQTVVQHTTVVVNKPAQAPTNSFNLVKPTPAPLTPTRVCAPITPAPRSSFNFSKPSSRRR